MRQSLWRHRVSSPKASAYFSLSSATVSRPRPGKKSRPSSAARLLRKAQGWQQQLKNGEIENQAAIARREGLTRARITQIMGLLRLAPDIRAQILSAPAAARCRDHVAERTLRSVLGEGTFARQRRAWRRLSSRRR